MPLVAIRLMGRVRMLVRLEKQRVQAQGLTEEWLKRAKLALEKGDEEAARAALERKNQQEEQANSLGAQLESQEQAVQNLFAQMQQLEQKISEAKMKKDQLKARAQTAKVSTKINDMMSKSSSTGALEAFNRMSDKVEQMEAEAEVARELSGSDTSLDKRFAALESSSKVAPPPRPGLFQPMAGGRGVASLQLSPRARARGLCACAEEAGLKAGRAVQVDDDLAALKGLVGGSSAPKSLTSGDGGGAVDDELQKYARAPGPARPLSPCPGRGRGGRRARLLPLLVLCVCRGAGGLLTVPCEFGRMKDSMNKK